MQNICEKFNFFKFIIQNVSNLRFLIRHLISQRNHVIGFMVL